MKKTNGDDAPATLKPSWTPAEAGCYHGCVRMDDEVIWTCSHVHEFRDFSPEAAEISALDCARGMLRIKNGRPDEPAEHLRRCEATLASVMSAPELAAPQLPAILRERGGDYARHFELDLSDPTTVGIHTPPDDEFIKLARNRRGKWTGGFWRFPRAKLESVLAAVVKVYPDFHELIAKRPAVVEARAAYDAAYEEWKRDIKRRKDAADAVIRAQVWIAHETYVRAELAKIATDVVFAKLANTIRNSRAIPWERGWNW